MSFHSSYDSERINYSGGGYPLNIKEHLPEYDGKVQRWRVSRVFAAHLIAFMSNFLLWFFCLIDHSIEEALINDSVSDIMILCVASNFMTGGIVSVSWCMTEKKQDLPLPYEWCWKTLEFINFVLATLSFLFTCPQGELEHCKVKDHVFSWQENNSLYLCLIIMMNAIVLPLFYCVPSTDFFDRLCCKPELKRREDSFHGSGFSGENPFAVQAGTQAPMRASLFPQYSSLS